MSEPRGEWDHEFAGEEPVEQTYPFLYGYARSVLETTLGRLEATRLWSRGEVFDLLKGSIEKLDQYERKDEEEE